jgi:hypothetical protein
MSHYQFPHPWDPGYAIPAYVAAEPQGRGTFTTKEIPRRTISEPPRDRQVYNRTRWATPNYAQGRYTKNPLTTKMIPRRTVSLLAPDFFGRPAAPGIATGSVLDGNTLDGNTLGDHAAPSRVEDPIISFGKRGSTLVLRELRRAKTAAQRSAVFAKIDSGFEREVEKKTAAFKAKGYPAKSALQRAIAAALSNQLASEFLQLGRPDALSGFFSGIGKAFTGAIGGSVKGLGKLACGVATSPAGGFAGAAAGAAAGGPAGAQVGLMGAQTAQGMCAGAPPIQPMYGFPAASTFPILPVAIGAGVLVLVLALK